MRKHPGDRTDAGSNTMLPICYLPQKVNPFDTTIEWMLVALLAFMPFALGARSDWSQEVVIFISGAIVICFLLKLLCHHNVPLIRTWAYLPIGIFILIVVFQLIPLPVSLISIISPHTAALKTELLNDLPDSETALKSMTLSFYPNATSHGLRLALAVAAVFVVVLNVFRRPDQIKRLLKAIALIGGAIAMLALIQNFFGNGKIYWFIPNPCSKTISGPFVNHSHYGQFINLSIGAALAWLLVKLHEDFAGKKLTVPVVFEYFSSSAAKPLWLIIAIMSLAAATVFLSLTRGGMVSMLIAAAFTTLLLTSKRPLQGHGWIMVVMALAAFTCILYLGFDAVFERLASLKDFQRAQAGRLQILKDISVLFRSFPLLGTGLGTHSVVYPMFDRSIITALATHAENEYAQVVEETGLIGLGSLILFAIIIWANFAKSIRHSNSSINLAAYGLGFGLMAILVHSLSDFGQHVPANTFLSAIFCALLLSLARQGQKNQKIQHSIKTSPTSKHLHAAALLIVSGIWGWTLVNADKARIAETEWKKAIVIKKNLVKENWHGSKEDYDKLISLAAEASYLQPENVEYKYWLNVYRFRKVCQAIDPVAAEPVIDEESMPLVQNIVNELHQARTLCPTFGSVYCVLGQIEMFILDEPAGSERIRKGYRLAPCDPIACFVAGSLDIAEGNIDESLEKFKKTVQLDHRYFKGIIDIYLYQVNRPDLAIAIAGNDIYRLSSVANRLANMNEYKELAEHARAKIIKLLSQKCSQPDVTALSFASLGNIYRQQNKEAAIEYYQKALELDYGQVEYRFALAKLFADTGNIRQAIYQARICLRLRPQLKAAEEFVAELSVHPAAFDHNINSH